MSILLIILVIIVLIAIFVISVYNGLVQARIKVDNAWISIYSFERTSSGYVGKRKMVYHGQVKNLERRLK